jgi:hypothetical protein
MNYITNERKTENIRKRKYSGNSEVSGSYDGKYEDILLEYGAV